MNSLELYATYTFVINGKISVVAKNIEDATFFANKEYEKANVSLKTEQK